MERCDACDREIDRLPYRCNFCESSFCSEHRLPENHRCIGLPGATTLGPEFRNLASTETTPMIGTPIDSEDSSEDECEFCGEPTTSSRGACRSCLADRISARGRFETDKSEDETRTSSNSSNPSNSSSSSTSNPDADTPSNADSTSEFPDPPDPDEDFSSSLAARLVRLPLTLLLWLVAISLVLISLFRKLLLLPLAPFKVLSSRRRLRWYYRRNRMFIFVFSIIVLTVSGAVGGALLLDSGVLVDDLEIDRAEQLALEEANAERGRAGVHPLIWHDRLHSAARHHSEDMGERGYFNHTSPDGLTPEDRVRMVGASCYLVSENLAMGEIYRSNTMMDGSSIRLDSEENLAEYAVRAWMLSEDGHREALLNPQWSFAAVGIAVVDDEVYFTMKFCG